MSESEPHTDPAISDELLASALDGARARRDDVEAQIETLMGRREAAHREVRLLEQLQAIRRGDSIEPTATPDGPVPRPRTAGHEGVGRAAVEAAVAQLEEAGHPLHISELMSALNEQKVNIPGAGTQANLIAHLTRDDRIVRPSRGMYALAAWGVPDAAPLKRAKRTRVSGGSKQSAMRRTSR